MDKNQVLRILRSLRDVQLNTAPVANSVNANALKQAIEWIEYFVPEDLETVGRLQMRLAPESNEFNPDWVTHPIETIEDLLEEKEMSWLQLFHKLSFSLQDTLDFVNRRRSIDRPLAEKLSAAIGSSPEFWLNRQKQYEENIKKYTGDNRS